MASVPPKFFELFTGGFFIRPVTTSDAHERLTGWTRDRLAAEMLNTPQRDWTIEAQSAFFSESSAQSNKIVLGVLPKDQPQLIGLYIMRLQVPNSTFTVSHLIGDTAWRGKNVSGEASDAIMDYFFNRLGFHKAKANVQPHNKAMLWLMLRGAWKKEAYLTKHLRVQDTGQRADVISLGMLASDWRKLQKPVAL